MRERRAGKTNRGRIKGGKERREGTEGVQASLCQLPADFPRWCQIPRIYWCSHWSLPVHPSTPQQSVAIYLPQRRGVLALKAPIHPGWNKEAELDGFGVKKRLACGRSMSSRVRDPRRDWGGGTAARPSQLGCGENGMENCDSSRKICRALGPVQPGLIPAQGSFLIKCPFNPWIFCLGWNSNLSESLSTTKALEG